MLIRKWIKKSVGIFFSFAILCNVAAPIFAYSSSDCLVFSDDVFKVRISDDSSCDDVMEINLGNDKISLSLGEKTGDKTNNSKELANGKVKQIEDVLPDVSVRYKVKNRGLKEDFILHSKAAQNSFDLKYNIGSLEAKQLNEQNILLLDKSGYIKTIISAPYMTDAKGERSFNVWFEILNQNDNILSVKLTADYSWLQEDKRQYPVEVDPTYDTLPTNTMKKGDNNEQVALLKNMLFESGIGAGVSMHDAKRDMKNNVFSNITEKFVTAFQIAMDLNPTGIADANTLAALRMHLERKGVLDTQEHTEQFLRRAESRSSSETSGFFANMANFFGRINLADLLVTSGTVAVVAGISAFCTPVTATGIVYMLVGGTAIGSVAGGVSEYTQQKLVGREIDFGRVAIKATGGALKGTICSVPGAGVGMRGMCLLSGGIGAVGTSENLLCSVKSRGLSGETVGDALINGVAQGLAAIPSASLARGVVNGLKPETLHPLEGLGDPSLASNSASKIGQAAGVGAAGLGKKVSDKSKESSKVNEDKSESNTMNLSKDSKDVKGNGTNNLLGKRESMNLVNTVNKPKEKAAETRTEQKKNSGKRISKVKTDKFLSEHASNVPGRQMPKKFGDFLNGGMYDLQRFMHNQALVDTSKPINQLIDEKWKSTVIGSQMMFSDRQISKSIEMQKELYRKDLEFVAGVRECAKKNIIYLDSETKRKLDIFECMAHGEIRTREAAQNGDLGSQIRLNAELTKDPQQVMNDQIKRYKEEFCRQFCNALARIYG